MSKEEVRQKLVEDHGLEISPATVGRIIRRHNLFFADTPSHKQKRRQQQQSMHDTETQPTQSTASDTDEPQTGTLPLSPAPHLSAFLIGVVTLGALALTDVPRAFASESSSFRMYDESVNYSTGSPQESSSFQMNDNGITWYKLPVVGSSVEIATAPPAPTVDGNDDDDGDDVDDDVPDSGGGRRGDGGPPTPSPTLPEEEPTEEPTVPVTPVPPVVVEPEEPPRIVLEDEVPLLSALPEPKQILSFSEDAVSTIAPPALSMSTDLLCAPCPICLVGSMPRYDTSIGPDYVTPATSPVENKGSCPRCENCLIGAMDQWMHRDQFHAAAPEPTIPAVATVLLAALLAIAGLLRLLLDAARSGAKHHFFFLPIFFVRRKDEEEEEEKKKKSANQKNMKHSRASKRT